MESLPNDVTIDQKAMIYSTSTKNENGVLTISRTRKTLNVLFPIENYPAIRAFYNNLIAGDSRQAALKVSASVN